MKLELIGKRTGERDDKTYVSTSYSIGGYAVKVVDVTYSDGFKYTDISCQVAEDNDFLPSIYYRDGWPENRAARFEIQTTSYGALEIGEFKKFLAAQQRALEVAEVLNREFCEKKEG